MPDLQQIIVTDIAHGGQSVGELPSGKKVFVWNALPGETVLARIIKNKRSYAEAIAETIITASSRRIEPEEHNYLATSPWQMMDYTYENELKRQIPLDAARREHVQLPADISQTIAPPIDAQWHYRNKMEYSFWGDDDGLHLALHQRGSSGKQIVDGSKLALPAIDRAANAVCAQLQALGVRAGDLKTIVIRCDQHGNAVAALFIKPIEFPELTLNEDLQGLRVYHSNPKSPASVPTELLQELGDPTLTDTIASGQLTYDVDSFFQVNVPVANTAVQSIARLLPEPQVLDMYAGVGSIGLSVASQQVTLIELDPATANMATVNAAASTLVTNVVATSAERSLEYISGKVPIIVDPPRAGLHPSVTKRLLEMQPPTIIYLSCNPSTQARDMAALQDTYEIDFFEVYNFFPRTPHIECLARLTRRV